MNDSVLIDVSRLMGRLGKGRLPTGVDRVCQAYVRHWGPMAQAVLQWGAWRLIAPAGISQELFALLLDTPAEFRRRAAALLTRGCLPPWPAQDAQGRILFSLAQSNIEQPGAIAWLARTRQRPVFFVHDLIPITHPEYCRPGEQMRHTKRMETLLSVGAGLVCNSHSTLEQLQRFASQRSLLVPPAVVAHLAPAALPDASKSQPPLPVPYFVVLGTIEPRKNHLLLLELWRELVADMGEGAPHLVIIGQRGWECENVIDMLERCPSLQGMVHELPACPDAELARYLHHARALLFPSFAEGFGIPLVEALKAGTPVIASKLEVFNEVAGGVPDFIDNLEGMRWLETIKDYARPQSAARAAQQRRMSVLQLPTWNEHFATVQGLLERLA